MSWRRAGRWAAALVLLFACNQAPKHEERPGMVYILADEFLMGSAAGDPEADPGERPHEQPQHPLFVDAFYMDVHEVTNAEYERSCRSLSESQPPLSRARTTAMASHSARTSWVRT